MNVTKTASKLLEFFQNPLPIYDAVAIRAIAYFYQTKIFAIKYSNKNLKNYIFVKINNAMFGDNLASKKSTQSYLFILYEGPID